MFQTTNQYVYIDSAGASGVLTVKMMLEKLDGRDLKGCATGASLGGKGKG